MKEEEQIVQDYLISEGFNSIEFEPDGNIPPDFSINNNIAIEVRRLNENYFDENKRIGNYEEFYRLRYFIDHFLQDYKNEELRASYMLMIGYERPLPNFAELKRDLKINLDNFIMNPMPNVKIKITPTFTITLYPIKTRTKHKIHLSSSHDDNGGGAVTQIYISNINYCLKEKTDKILKYKSNYSQWWLILVDSMFYRVLDDALKHVPENIILPDEWDKLVIINPDNKKATLVLSK